MITSKEPSFVSLCFTGVLFLWCGFAQVFGAIDIDSYTRNDNFTLKTDSLEVIISPAKAFTISGIAYEGRDIGKSNGNYGFVVAHAEHYWIGSGHREGGKENVMNVSLYANGEKIDLPYSDSVSGSRFTLIKESAISDDIVFTTTLEVHADHIIEKTEGRFLKDTTLFRWYPFMYVWTEETSLWYAKGKQGEILLGTLEEPGFELQKDVLWTSVYSPSMQTGVVTYFGGDFPAGAGFAHAYWVRPDYYHKQYFMMSANDTFKAGETFSFQVSVFFASIESEDQFHEKIDGMIDAIETALSIPEPASGLLVLAGAFAAFLARRKNDRFRRK